MILLAFFFPLAVYLLFLGILNRGRHPVIVSGIWDGIGLLFGVSGFLLFAGPAILSTLSERWRLFWLLGRGDIAHAVAEGALPMWTFLALLYFLLIVGGSTWHIWRQRRQTAIYNTNVETVEDALLDVCKERGINPMRNGDLFLFGASNAPMLSRDHKESIQQSSAHSIQSATNTPMLSRDRTRVEEVAPAILEVDSFPLMHHVTLRWEPADAPVRRIVEGELSRRLELTVGDDSFLGGWLLTLGFLLLSFDLAGAFFLIVLNLHPFLR